jgi:hypothetical protein
MWTLIAAHTGSAERPEMADQLELATLHRIGSADPMKRERYTFDFVVNGMSLFEATQASRFDMCGSLSDPKFEPEVARRLNGGIAATLTSDVPAGSGRRVAACFLSSTLNRHLR